MMRLHFAITLKIGLESHQRRYTYIFHGETTSVLSLTYQYVDMPFAQKNICV